MNRIRQACFLTLFAVLSSACSYVDQNLGPVSSYDLLSAGSDAYKAASLNDVEAAKLAREVALEADRNNKIADSSSIYTRRLAKMIIPHLSEDGLKLNYKIYVDEEINAFSLADGSIRINSGLMDLLNDRELLAVIGHEIGHIKLGHSRAQLQRTYAASAALKTASSSIRSGMDATAAGVVGALGASALADLASDVIQAQFSQSDETEADEYAVEFLRRHNYEPRSLVVALSKFRDMENESDANTLAQLFSSHPASGDRIEHVEQILAENIHPAPKVQLAAIEEPDAVTPRVEKAQKESVPLKAPAAKPQTQMARNRESHKAQNGEPTPPPAPMLAPVEEETSASPEAGWYIQLAAFPEQTSANDMKAALHERNVEAKIQSTLVKGAEYQRVLVGPFPTRKSADARVDEVASHGIFEGEPFIRHLPK